MMSDELKLLNALCDALGFDVQKNVDVRSGRIVDWSDHTPFLGQSPFPAGTSYEFIGDGKYQERLFEVSYKVVKKNQGS